MRFGGRLVEAKTGLVEFDGFKLGLVGLEKSLWVDVTSPCS